MAEGAGAAAEPGVVLVDSASAAVAAQVRPSTLRGWAHRGLLEAKGRDARGRALYSLADVYRVKVAVSSRRGRGVQ